MNTTIFEHIRYHALTGRLLGTTYPELKKSQWSHRFEKLMRNRLIVGAMRYGLSFGIIAGKEPYDRIDDIQRRLDKYSEDGNLEHLVDCANLLMLEFHEGAHPNAHFKSGDDGEHTKIKEKDE